MAFADNIKLPEESEGELPEDRIHGPASEVLSALEHLSRLLQPNGLGPFSNSNTTRFIGEWRRLTNALQLAKDEIHAPTPGRGLLSLWLRAVARRCIAAEQAVESYQQRQLFELLTHDNNILHWLIFDGRQLGVEIQGWMARKSVGLASLLAPAEQADSATQLRALSDEWFEAFRDAPTEPQGSQLVRQEIHDAWRPWGEKRDQLLRRAGTLWLRCVNDVRVKWELAEDESLCDGLIQSIQYPESFLRRTLGLTAKATDLQGFLDHWLARPRKGVKALGFSSEGLQFEAGNAPELPGPELIDTPSNMLPTSLATLRDQFVDASRRHKPLSVVLVNTSIPGNKPEPSWPDLQAAQGKHALSIGGGPHSEPTQLFDRASYEAVRDNPFYDVDGNPIVTTAGEPIPLRPGWAREYRLYGNQFPGSSDWDYNEALSEWNDAATEGGRLLRALPDWLKQVVWQAWGGGFWSGQADGPDLWTNAVFELAWQKRTGSPLAAERLAWLENHTLKIEDLPKYRSSTNGPRAQGFDELVEHVGNPPAYWYSELSNVWRASEAAVALLLHWLEHPPGTSSNIESPPEAIMTGPPVVAQVNAKKPTDPKMTKEVANAKKPKPTVNERMKAEMASNLETVKGWAAKQWADHLGCGQTTIKDTETWKSLALLRQQVKAEKRKDRRRR